MDSNQIKRGIGGGLALLCLGLIILGPLGTLGNIGNTMSELEKNGQFFDKYPGICNFFRFDMAVRGIISVFGISVGLNLYHIKYGALKMAKTYLLVVMSYGCIYGLSPILFTGLPEEIENYLWDASLVTAIQLLLIGGVWYAYLNMSSRVKNTYLS
ncbi:MAG: hypothetical protein RLZ10_2511 [Bacteroidota bacterium]|jgi:hypothetical protein